jgi:hypothetical protein
VDVYGALCVGDWRHLLSICTLDVWVGVESTLLSRSTMAPFMGIRLRKVLLQGCGGRLLTAFWQIDIPEAILPSMAVHLLLLAWTPRIVRLYSNTFPILNFRLIPSTYTLDINKHTQSPLMYFIKL